MLATPGVQAQPQRLSALRRVPTGGLLGGLVVLPALLFGVLAVLVPLKLHAHGWGGVAIGALFLATAGLEMALNPLLGQFSDKRGRLLPVRIALLGSIAGLVAFAWADSPAVIAGLRRDRRAHLRRRSTRRGWRSSPTLRSGETSRPRSCSAR